jgi:hypothetical protein
MFKETIAKKQSYEIPNNDNSSELVRIKSTTNVHISATKKISALSQNSDSDSDSDSDEQTAETTHEIISSPDVISMAHLVVYLQPVKFVSFEKKEGNQVFLKLSQKIVLNQQSTHLRSKLFIRNVIVHRNKSIQFAQRQTD